MFLLREVVAGLVVGLVAISFYISCAALLFQGALEQYMPTAIGIALAGGGILALINAWKSSIALSSVGPEPATIPVVAGLTAAIGLQLSGPEAFATTVMAITLSGVVIGAIWYLLGHFGAGDLIRYIPYPVIGGFLGAVGWLMFSGGIGVVVGKPFSIPMGISLLTHLPSGQLVAGLLVAALLWFATQRFKHVLTLPMLIVGATLAIHGWLSFSGIEIEAARQAGWLMKAFSEATSVFPFSAEILANTRWSLLLQESGLILSAAVVSTIALLLSDSSLEVAFDERAELNGDLKLLGIGNLVVAGAGGLVGGISISRSILNRQAGASGRASGMVLAAFCFLAMYVGGSVISLIPRGIFGGILIYMGLGMLKFWLMDARKRLSMSDYLVVVTIVTLTIFVSYLPAVIVGVVFCCFNFAISMASLTAIRREYSRNAWPNHIERNQADGQYLQTLGEHLRIIELQGTLFFGSVRSLSYEIENLLTKSEHLIDALILDFRRVSEIDSSAAQVFARIEKMAGKQGAALIYTALTPAMKKVLAANGCLTQANMVRDDINHATQEWEDEQLAKECAHTQFDISEWLSTELGSDVLLENLKSRIERVELERGQRLFEQGQIADALYLVENGRLSAFIEDSDGVKHIRKIQAGGTVGEMGLYRSTHRSATVAADSHTTVWKLSDTAMAKIEQEMPNLAILLHRLFVRLLATRLEHANAQASMMAG